MQQSHEKKIRENLSTLVDLTSNVDDILKALKDKELVTDEEQEKIVTADSPFDKKSQLFWLISKKDEKAFDALIEVLKSTGNNEAAGKLLEKSPQVEVEGEVVQAEVTLESHHREQDDEGIAFAEEIEKEFDRIQTEVDNEASAEVVVEDEKVEQTAAAVVEVFDKEMDEYKISDAPIVHSDEQQLETDGENNVESEVRVEITLAESEPEIEAVSVVNKVEDGLDEIVKVEESKDDEAQEVEVQKAVNNSAEVVVEEAPKPQKQVTFGIVKDEPKELILNEPEADEESISPSGRRSLVQLNREKFEKSAPAGVKVKYNFKSNNEPMVEEPKESTVKNLRNFFQKLGSADKEEVTKRQGSKMGGVHPNRRTMAL